MKRTHGRWRDRCALGSTGRLLISALFLAGVLACGPQGERAAPNVVLITIDTLRADHLGTYGFAHATSPNIDALAADAVVFERAIASAGRTVPAHVSIMTSRRTREHSVGHHNGGSTLRGLETLAGHFRAGGYDTAAFVGNLLLVGDTGLRQGFDLFDAELETPELNRPNVVERLAPDTTRRAIEWLAGERDRPFFLWVHYQDPHGPYTPPPEHRDRFRIEPPPDEPALPIARGGQKKDSIPAYQALPGLDRASQYVGRYAGEIAFTDHWIGELLAAIDASSGGRETLILLTSDHGESLGEEGVYFVHADGSAPDVAHVPLILRAPGLPPQRLAELVSHVDVLPTLLELSGLEVPVSASGVALGPVVRGGAALPDRYVYCDNGDQLSAYRGAEVVEVSGVEGAWQEDTTSAPGSKMRWRRYRWQPGRSDWSRVRRGALPDEIADYSRAAEPMALLPPPDPEMVRALKALGYVEP